MNYARKKVLLISYAFPPGSVSAVWWVLSLVKYLPDLGWSPIVVCLDEDAHEVNDYSLLEQVPLGTAVHKVGYRMLPTELRFALAKLKLNMSFPDDCRNWLSPAYKEAKRLLQQQKIDLVVSTAPPFTSHFVAMKLKKEFKIPWITHWLDPWTGNDIANFDRTRDQIKPLRKLHKIRSERAERRLLTIADKTIVHAQLHKQQLCEQFNVPDDNVKYIPFGYDESAFEAANQYTLYPDKLTITFPGVFYPGFKKIASMFLNAVEQVDKEVEVILIGGAALLMSTISRANLTCIGYLPHGKAMGLALGSDFLLLLTLPSYRMNIPSKIWEYLRLGKPILALVPEDGEAARVIKEAGAGFILSYEEDKLKQQLADIFARWRKGEFANFIPDMEYVRRLERKKGAEQLARIFDEVVSTCPTRGGKK